MEGRISNVKKPTTQQMPFWTAILPFGQRKVRTGPQRRQENCKVLVPTLCVGSRVAGVFVPTQSVAANFRTIRSPAAAGERWQHFHQGARCDSIMVILACSRSFSLFPTPLRLEKKNDEKLVAADSSRARDRRRLWDGPTEERGRRGDGFCVCQKSLPPERGLPRGCRPLPCAQWRRRSNASLGSGLTERMGRWKVSGPTANPGAGRSGWRARGAKEVFG